MEEKRYVSTGKFTSEIIFGVIVNGILFGIVFAIISSLLESVFATSSVLKSIITIVLDIICLCLVWKTTITSVIKKNTTDKSKIDTIVRNVLIILIIILVVTVGIEIFQTESQIATLTKIWGNSGFIESIRTLRITKYTVLAVSKVISIIVYICIIRYVKYRLETEL